MYGEIFNRNRGGDVSDVAELLFADASRRAVHTFRLTLEGEKT